MSTPKATPKGGKTAKTKGWVEAKDPKSGRSFYHNRETGERSWKKPAVYKALPKGGSGKTDPAEWREIVDKKSGRPFYVNKTTGEKTWAKPKGFVGGGGGGGTPKATPKAATAGAPAKGRPKWRELKDKKTGRAYYVNTQTKKTTWKRPPELGPDPETRGRASPAPAKRGGTAATGAAAAGKGRTRGKDNDSGADDEDDEKSAAGAAEEKSDEKEPSRSRAAAGAAAAAAAARAEDMLDDYDSYSDDDYDEEDEEEDARANAAARAGADDDAALLDPDLDDFTQAFKLLPKTEDEAQLLRRLDLLSVDDPAGDPRVPPLVHRRRGLFAALVRVFKRFPQNEVVVARAMSVLKKFGSVEDFVIPAVESDIVGRVIATMTLHMNSKAVVGDAVILLGNLSLNDYVKELIRMEEGVKVISLVMLNELHQDDAAILDKCCYCLANLAVDNVENVREIIAGGALASTISCMERFRNNSDLLDSGTVVLSNLCAGGEEHRRAIAEAGAVRALVSIIEHQCDEERARGEKQQQQQEQGSNASAAAAAASLQVMQDCLRALGNLGLHADTIPLMLRDGAVHALVRSVDDMARHPSVVTLSVSVLGNLAANCDTDQVAVMARDGGVAAVVRASRALPDHVDVQKAFFGSLANFAKAPVNADSAVDQAVMEAVTHVRSVMERLDSHEDVLSRGLRLVVRVAQQEHRTWRLVKEDGFPSFLARLLRHRSRSGASVKLVRDALLCTAAVSNESTARDVATAPGQLVETITGVVVEMEEDQKVVEAAVKALRNLAVHPTAALKVATSGVAALTDAARRFRNKPGFVEKVAPLFGDLAVFEGTAEFLSEAGSGELLVELLEEYSRSPGIAAKIIVALHNMTLSDEMFGRRLKAARVDRSVNPIVDEHGGNVALRSAATVFLARLRELPDLGDADDRRFEELDEDEKNRLLREKFNVPELPRAVVNFLTAGQTLRLHRRSGNPKQRHIFVSDRVRFLCVREPGDEKAEKHPLRRVTEVVRYVPGAGGAGRALERTYFMGKKAKGDCCVMITMEEQEEPLCLECGSPAERDQWFSVLTDAVEYRKTLQKLRSELTEEERLAYF